MSLDFLTNSTKPLDEMDLQECERHALCSDTLIQQIAARLLVEVRKLQNQLNDPAYMYAGSRIHRHALVVREFRKAELPKLFFYHDRERLRMLCVPAASRVLAKSHLLKVLTRYKEEDINAMPTAETHFDPAGYVEFGFKQEDFKRE